MLVRGLVVATLLMMACLAGGCGAECSLGAPQGEDGCPEGQICVFDSEAMFGGTVCRDASLFGL
ncbi:MAG: hypothetical protein MI923_29000 [Phycisphaerales bacterium]|nr:hypothetical protein [Phycisphaerales bacterium]